MPPLAILSPDSLLMQNFLRFLLLVATLSSALAQREIDPIVVAIDSKTIPVRITASPELNALVQHAFAAHGQYRVVSSGQAYEFKFSTAAANQVRVEISKGSNGTPVGSQIVAGNSARHALMRAADVAVEKTSGLKGIFAAKLAYIGEKTGRKEVYTSDLFFGEVQQITHDNALALMPRWHPDGMRIIYTSYFRGAPDIYLLDLSANRRDTLVALKGTNQGGRFSPDGQRIAMVLSGEGTPEIYVSNARGRGITRMTRSDAVKSSPCFSPDGSRLVFSSDPGPQLYIMSAVGGPTQRITQGVSSYCAEPDWSRGNPNKIAFTMREGRNYQIAVLDLATKVGGKVSNSAYDGVEPSWLADGRHLVFTERNSRESWISILDTETKKTTRLSPPSLGAAMQANAWSP